MEHYKLLTPGPLTTSETVKKAMLTDWCTWDDDYNINIVQHIRSRLVTLATTQSGYSSVLMQGSGTASVESVLGSAIGSQDKILIINNGAYGQRMLEICQMLSLNHLALTYPETSLPDLAEITEVLNNNRDINYLAMVHCETTTGMLNPLEAIARLCQQHQITFILDAMSSFGGMVFDIGELNVGYLISSANKCIQGIPGFGFIIAKRDLLEQCEGKAKSVSLDLYSQWKTMENTPGKWRFTSPTHVVRAFYQALEELEQEGGIPARSQRYHHNQRQLVAGMEAMGFRCLLEAHNQSAIITSFLSPESEDYDFKQFYLSLKSKGFVIYPGKVSQADCFRVGNIGEISSKDIEQLLEAIKQVRFWYPPEPTDKT